MDPNQPKPAVSKWLWITLILVVLIAGGFFAWYYLIGPGKTVATTPITTPVATTTTKTADETADWQTYTNSEVGFSFKYPETWTNVKLNVLNNTAGGKYIASNDGKTGPVYFDPNKIFDFVANSSDYKPGAPLPNMSYNKIKIDPTWIANQMETQMGFVNGTNSLPQIMLVKKLSTKSVLVGDYQAIECSPGFRLQVITPLNDIYPNLQIAINIPNLTSDPILKSYESSQTAKGLDACDEAAQYQQIADKIKNGTYSDDVVSYIKTAQLIADSLKLTK